LADILPTRLLQQKAQLELNEALKQKTENLIRLSEAIGVSTAALEHCEFQFDLEHISTDMDIPTATKLRRQALLARPDALIALSDYAASQSALQLEIAKQYPDLHLGPGYQFDQGEHKWEMGFSLELPLLNRNQGPIAEA
jgi:outer membrane protein TolC